MKPQLNLPKCVFARALLAVAFSLTTPLIFGASPESPPAPPFACPAPSFAAARVYDNGGEYALIVSSISADFNGDSRLDLAIADLHPTLGRIAVMLGNGDGTFKAAAKFAAGRFPVFVVIGDFDNDHRQDLAVANEGDPFSTPPLEGSISVLLGKGDGSFQAAKNFMAGAIPNRLAAEDFNRDGHPDLAVLNSGAFDASALVVTNSSVAMLIGKPDGTFKAPVHYPSKPPASNVLLVGDFDRDGKIDVIAASHGFNRRSGNIAIFLGRGDGTLAPPNKYGDEPYFAPIIADINHDGQLDVIAGYSRLIGQGDGTFKVDPLVAVDQLFREGSTLEDFNGDGLIDRAEPYLEFDDWSQSWNLPGGVRIRLGKPNGVFEAGTDYATGAFALFVTTGDLDRDGKTDLVTINPWRTNEFLSISGGLSVLLGRGDGTFKPPVKYPAFGASAVVADLNGDDIPDLVTRGVNGYTPVSVLFGNGDGTFQTPAQFGAGGGTGFPVTGDFNQDGMPDIAVANASESRAPGAISILHNTCVAPPRGPVLVIAREGAAFKISWAPTPTQFVLEASPRLPPPKSLSSVTRTRSSRWAVLRIAASPGSVGQSPLHTTSCPQLSRCPRAWSERHVSKRSFTLLPRRASGPRAHARPSGGHMPGRRVSHRAPAKGTPATSHPSCHPLPASPKHARRQADALE